jgi:DNA-binding GntR family transcriptional regulator
MSITCYVSRSEIVSNLRPTLKGIDMATAFSEGEPASRRQSDQAFEKIKNEIILCRLPPGARFSEGELSERFGLARAATRAALMRLAEVRLVEPVPRHGFVVTPITVTSIRELFEVRLIVEPQAAALAVGKIDPAKLRTLNLSPQNAGSDVEQLAFVKSNRAFHREIAVATGNSRLVHILESLADEMQRLVQLGLFGPGGNEVEQRSADAQHEALIVAFEQGDVRAAERAARVHIEHSRSLAMNHIVIGHAPLSIA